MPPTPETAFRIGQTLRELLRLAPEIHATLARRVGIGVTDLIALDHVTASDTPLGVVELGNRLGIRSASATVLVDRLTAAGHLERVPHETDRRRITVRPTDAARTDALEALGPLVPKILEVVGKLDADSAEEILVFLQEISATLTAFCAAFSEWNHNVSVVKTPNV
ncbi:winged helix-turn-helix transcriptional regulator [Amycolatopsis acidicola]|uniref:Winged helix-turn-helix transcriptional regulator n=1 Tax=Amycolatopsis acidicola TaxID=2596893 RepID=A0A5N0VM49_9PSEU|nr:MarR family winged helix-turn-helix transcriptional regulator [Amycolatopsis acidicola]KAA9166384.1 winged helix-turn-helix transcriptional regulator [Amycolatopsis acidicola]